MYCANCGTQISDSDTFCSNCGKPTAQPSEGTAAGIQPAAQSEASLMTSPPAKPKAGKKIKSFITALTVIVVLIFGVYSMQKHPVADLKDITFDAYDISFGEAVSNSMKNVSWKSEKVDKARYRVTMQGFCPEEYSYIGISVDLTYADDHVYASIDSVTVDDEVYDSYLMIAYVMDMVHGE